MRKATTYAYLRACAEGVYSARRYAAMTEKDVAVVNGWLKEFIAGVW